MAVGQHKVNASDCAQQVAGDGLLGFPQSHASIHDLNRQTLALLVDLSHTLPGEPDWEGWATVARCLHGIDQASVEALAQCPFLLLDVGFEDSMHWQVPADHPVNDAPVLIGPRRRIAKLAQAACSLAWHLVHSDPISAKLVLGIGPTSASAIVRMSLIDFHEIALGFVLDGSIQPRWHNRPETWHRLVHWHRLVQMKQTGWRPPVPSVAERGLHLFLGDLLAHDRAEAQAIDGSRQRRLAVDPPIEPAVPPSQHTSAITNINSSRNRPRELDEILRTRDVVRIARRHRSTIYRWMRAGVFPKQHSFNGRQVGWRRSDVERWLAGDPETST